MLRRIFRPRRQEGSGAGGWEDVDLALILNTKQNHTGRISAYKRDIWYVTWKVLIQE
jgi:hypothetical protein